MTIVSILIGLRAENIGLDSFGYASFYAGKYNRDLGSIFLLLSFILHFISELPQIFYTVVSLLTNIIILLAFKKINKHYPLIIALLFSTLIFVNININIIRQGLSIALVLYAVASLVKNQNIYFWVFSLLAMLTHFSSAFVIGFYFIKKIELNKRNILIYTMVCIILYLFKFSDVLVLIKNSNEDISRLYSYFTWVILEPWRIKHFYYLVFFLLFTYLLLMLHRMDSTTTHLFQFYMYGILLIFLFKEEAMVVDRIFYYFFFIGFVLILQLEKIVREKNIFYLTLYVSINLWFIKSMFLQYPKWFIPPYEGIR